MRIERVELRKILLPYPSVFETSGWRETGSHAVIVRVDAGGVTGWGESPVGESPFYNEENTRTVWAMMQDFLVPTLLAYGPGGTYRCDAGLCAGARQSHGQGGAGVRSVGPVRRGAGPQPEGDVGRHA